MGHVNATRVFCVCLCAKYMYKCYKLIKNHEVPVYKYQVSQVMKYFTKCAFHTSGSQYKHGFLQFLQDLSDLRSHLNQLSEKFLGNPHQF